MKAKANSTPSCVVPATSLGAGRRRCQSGVVHIGDLHTSGKVACFATTSLPRRLPVAIHRLVPVLLLQPGVVPHLVEASPVVELKRFCFFAVVQHAGHRFLVGMLGVVRAVGADDPDWCLECCGEIPAGLRDRPTRGVQPGRCKRIRLAFPRRMLANASTRAPRAYALDRF